VEHLGLPYVLGPALGLGLPGIILILWYFGDKARGKDLRTYREDTLKILAAYKEDMAAMRQMYKDNAALVKAYENVALSLREMVTLNTQAWQRAIDEICKRSWCPYIPGQEAPK
jgi:hypothetical protein